MTINYLFVAVIIYFIIRDFHQGNIHKPLFILVPTYLMFFFFGAVTFDTLRITSSRLYLIPFINLNLLALLAGIYLGKFRLLPQVSPSFIRKCTAIRSKELLLLFFAVCVMASALYFMRIGGIPLLNPNANEMKIEAMVGSGPIRIFIFALPVISLFFWYDYLKWPSPQTKIAAFSMIMFTMSIYIFSGARAETVTLAAQLAIVYKLINRGKINLAKGLAALVMVCSIIIVIGTYRDFQGQITGENLMVEMTKELTGRVAILDKIMSKSDELLMGKTYLMDLKKILPGEQTGFGVYVKEKFINNVHMPKNSGVNATLIGESYINFGYYGSLIAIFLYGFISKKLHCRLTAVVTREWTVLYAILIMRLVEAQLTGIGVRLPTISYNLFWFVFISILAKREVIMYSLRLNSSTQ